MDDRDRETKEPNGHEEETVRRLIEGAGRRPELPAAHLEAIIGAAGAAWREHVSRSADRGARRSFAPVWAALAATLLVALGLTWWWTRPRPVDVPQMVARVESLSGPARLTSGEGQAAVAVGRALPAGAFLQTGGPGGTAPGRMSLRLHTGAVLRLDEGTRLRLVSASLLVLESGAVYADTEPGAGRESAGGEPLAVRTALGTARDIGTRFAVRVGGPEPGVLEVRVREGTVRVERGERSYSATGGEELVLRRGGAVERRAVPIHGPGWEWTLEAAPSFDAEGRTVAELLDWVARETGWRVRFPDPAVADAAGEIVLQGSLAGVRPDQAPFAVLPAAGLEAELRDGVLVVRRSDGDGGRSPTSPR